MFSMFPIALWLIYGELRLYSVGYYHRSCDCEQRETYCTPDKKCGCYMADRSWCVSTYTRSELSRHQKVHHVTSFDELLNRGVHKPRSTWFDSQAGPNRRNVGKKPADKPNYTAQSVYDRNGYRNQNRNSGWVTSATGRGRVYRNYFQVRNSNSNARQPTSRKTTYYQPRRLPSRQENSYYRRQAPPSSSSFSNTAGRWGYSQVRIRGIGKPRATQRIKPKYSVKQKGAPKPIYPHSRRFASNRPVFRPSATPARGSVGRPVRPRGPKTPFQNESYVDICRDPRLDAITVLGNGTTFAFKDDLYWRLNQKSYEEGYPRQISPDWDGLPGHLDAAITDYDGDTYFFKGDSYWLYDPNGRRYKGYPRRISDGLVDVPDDIEAAMIWNYDDKPYFFKRSKYWQYSRWGQQPTWPRSIHEISSQLPHRLDAALKWTNAKSYIFAGHQYYRLSGWRHMKVVPGYPRHVGEWWFGCPKQRRTRRTRSISPRPDIFNQAHQDTCPTKGCCKSHYSKTIDYTQK